jgi:hypothetical protein
MSKSFVYNNTMVNIFNQMDEALDFGKLKLSFLIAIPCPKAKFCQ